MDTVPLDVSDSQVDEAQELEEDLRLAEKVAPLFCKFLLYASTTHFIFEVEEPDLGKDQYHTMMWYPGKSIAERRKHEYMDTHLNICTQSVACPSMSSNNSDSEGENC